MPADPAGAGLVAACVSANWRDGRRLAPSMLAAVFFHLLVFGLIGSARKDPPPVPSPIFLRWAPPSSTPAMLLPGPAVASGSALKNPLHGARSDRVRRPEPAATEADAKAVASSRTQDGGAARPSASALLIESARGLARQMAREGVRQQGKGSAPEERPFLPVLDRALRTPGAGETHLAGGIVKITTASGRSYCFLPPPDPGRGGLADALSVAGNCP